MIQGRVEGLQALLPVTLRLPDQPDLSIEFVVDTGFTGFLTLPPAAVSVLQLPYVEDITANLATDAEVMLPVHMATVIWDGQEREVQVLATGRRPLIGTALLSGHELLAQFADSGLVTVDLL